MESNMATAYTEYEIARDILKTIKRIPDWINTIDGIHKLPRLHRKKRINKKWLKKCGLWV